jgi:prevent-host-death family protein
MNATEARVRFGKLLRRVVEDGETVIVERDGKALAVVLSLAEYRRLRAECSEPRWRRALDKAARVAAQIRVRRGGRPLPPVEDVIREMREERDAQLNDLR